MVDSRELFSNIINPWIDWWNYSDIFGRKALLQSAVFLLGLGNLLCGFSKSAPQLYAFRAIRLVMILLSLP